VGIGSKLNNVDNLNNVHMKLADFSGIKRRYTEKLNLRNLKPTVRSNILGTV
jgi:hypothetical protein